MAQSHVEERARRTPVIAEADVVVVGGGTAESPPAKNRASTMILSRDCTILRDLATQYRSLCDSDANRRKRAMWRKLNNLQSERPMVFCNLGLLAEEIEPQLPQPRIEKESLRRVERWFQRQFWEAAIGDDRVFNPWYTVRADMLSRPEGVWGVAFSQMRDEHSRGWRHLPVLASIEDLARLKATAHEVVAPRPPAAQELEDAFGDILPVTVKRSTVYGLWGGTDLSQAPGQLFGLEELLLALCTEPAMIHKFMAFTRDAVLANLKQGEAAGDWSLTDSWYYSTPAFCDALPDPVANSYGAKLKDLAYFSHAQEFEGVSPRMYKEFLFDYQLPILELFGRVTYGCCETLDTKLVILEGVTNLSKIASGPRSDPARFPEKFGHRCVISWRPVSTLITMEHFNEEAQKRQLREGLARLKGCHVEVHMHEPMTVHNDTTRISRWAELALREAERAAD